MQQQQIYIVDNGLLLENTKRLQDGDELVEMPSSCFGINASHVPPPKGFRHPVNFPSCCEYHRDQFAGQVDCTINFRVVVQGTTGW